MCFAKISHINRHETINMNVYSWVFDTRIFLASSIADLEGAKFLNLTGLGCKYYLKSDDLK